MLVAAIAVLSMPVRGQTPKKCCVQTSQWSAKLADLSTINSEKFVSPSVCVSVCLCVTIYTFCCCCFRFDTSMTSVSTDISFSAHLTDLSTINPEIFVSLLSVFTRGNFSASLTRSTRPTTACGARSTLLWVQRNPSGNYQKTETRMVRANHMPQQPLQNHNSGHLGSWATP